MKTLANIAAQTSEFSGRKGEQQRHSASQSPHVPSLSLLRLQYAIGNQAVQRMIECGAIQPKFTISQPGDLYEQEADRVAEQVMHMPEPDMQRQTKLEEDEEENIQSKPLVSQMTPLMQRQVDDKEEEPLQAKTGSTLRPEAAPNIQALINALHGSGQPLPERTRAFFEPRFGYDFSQVRVHSGAKAAELAQVLDAQAFTVGQNVVFGTGQYTPETNKGQRLLAHELTHIVQQGAPDRPVASTVSSGIVQRAAPIAALIGAVVAKCMIGAIIGALFDAAIQAGLHSWKKRTRKFWQVSLNYCSLILSAILGCIAAPISAYILEPWITAQLGSKLGGIAGTLIGKILIFIAKKLGMAIPKGIVGKLLKLNCISQEQAAELGIESASIG